ncbi:hypothetical protein D3854_04545 [Streptococcus mutans]|jgi:hypothetical protein|uniref:DivIVA domain-containing protein n=2 Tax=Streptococcus mutans TaxID=1309 RepID=UPI0001B05556|nr:DivIVA domain-containing protein [Streptococcus mutans]AMF85245.1 hypothetical protein APQ13_02030 [Streptococcus mutans]EMB76552.1 hypothetical protein SMU50_09541 [Streptococcus mutans 5SM3]EMC04266.1 hypothetical protein SMU69_08054 [Streptococcus mutans NLML4]EMC05792.1 hypothetical protein SMU72_09813 [Streptococcus mutans NLML9]EMC13041.1 hypothetical protein SMU75_01706 [Streptococcus mutans N3209]
MITAKDIVGKSFLPHFKVIVRKEDDEFLDDITETLKTLEKENQSFKRQVKRLKEDQWDL